MNKALFLDRDGILIKERGNYNYLEEHFQINEQIIPLLQHAAGKGYLLIVITNQGGVEKKIYKASDIHQIHDKIKNYFENLSIVFTDFFHCEHHNTLSQCICRKPDSLMIEKACAIYDVDPNISFMVGDKETDKQAGEKVGVTGIQINANTTISNYKQLIN